jgi:hypothetical protein
MKAAAPASSPAIVSPAFLYTLLWIGGAMLMVAAALLAMPEAHVDGHYVPSNEDAFYHARRILDSVMTGAPVMQFDARIQVPEGDLVTWPWAYDTAMARITRLFGPFANEAAANHVLMNIPVVAGILAIALVVVLGRQLRLSFWQVALMVVAFTALPCVHEFFAVGNVDHHFAESLWVGMSICAGIWWLREPRRVAPAVVLGAILGLANGIQIGLFVLQISVVCWFVLQWLRGDALPPWRVVAMFGATLVAATLAMCLPSLALRQGVFQFFLLSWFHAYVAVGSALVCLATSVLPRKPVTIAALAVLALLLAVPLLGSLRMGAQYVGGAFDAIQDIVEARNAYAITLSDDLSSVPGFLWLVWLAAPGMLFAAWLAWRSDDPALRFYGIAAVIGLALLQFQFRLHVYGELALVATPMLAARLAAQRWPLAAPKVALCTTIVFLVALLPARNLLSEKHYLAGYVGFREFRSVFPVLHDACAKQPGIVLAGLEAGHWVHYFTDCSVIGNVFLVTPQETAKARETRHLMNLAPAELLATRPDIAYVFAFHSIPVEPGVEEPDFNAYRAYLPRLEFALLGPLDQLPPRFRPMWTVFTPKGQVYARLVAIERRAQ